MRQRHAIHRESIGIEVAVDGRFEVFRHDDKRYYVMADNGQRFEFLIRCVAPTSRAIAVVIVGDDGREKNIFLENGETDPNRFPADGGMYVVGQAGTSYNTVAVCGFVLPDRVQAFVFDGKGAGLADFPARFRIYVRTPAQGAAYLPDATLLADITIVTPADLGRLVA